MKIRVLFFAQLREKFGETEKLVEAREGMTVREFSESFLSEWDKGNPEAIPLSFAVNENFVGPAFVLKDGDTLALMTPVSGG